MWQHAIAASIALRWRILLDIVRYMFYDGAGPFGKRRFAEGSGVSGQGRRFWFLLSERRPAWPPHVRVIVLPPVLISLPPLRICPGRTPSAPSAPSGPAHSARSRPTRPTPKNRPGRGRPRARRGHGSTRSSTA